MPFSKLSALSSVISFPYRLDFNPSFLALVIILSISLNFFCLLLHILVVLIDLAVCLAKICTQKIDKSCQ